MKKQVFSMIQICLLFLTLGGLQTELYAQTPFTITWTGLTGSTSATGVPTGITIVQQYNGVTAACNTGANGATTSYSAVIQAAAGYNVTITSIGGAAYASNAGSRDFSFRVTNGATYTQASPTSIGSSSSCAGNTALTPFAVPVAGQTLNSGSQATITVLRAPGSAAGTGYSWTRSLTITGTVTPVCNAPTGLLASNLTSSSADLSWNAVSGSSGYQYVVDQVSTNPAGAGTATTGTTFSPTSLNPSTTYYLHVRNNCGGSNFSSWATVSFTTTAAPVCSVPTNLAENNVTATSADFNWDAAGSNDFEYVLDQLATNPSGAGTAINGVSTNTSTLSPLTTYYFHLRQNCGGGLFSNWVLVNFTTPVVPCAPPTGLAAANTTHNSSDLSWDIQGGNSFEYVVDQVVTDPVTIGTATTGTTFNATTLNPLTTYYLHVRTDCGAGNLSPWTTISFTTLIEPCDAPTGLTASNTTHNSSDLSWNVQGGNAFEYVVDQIAADPAMAGTPTTGTTYNATLLNPLTTYYLHVRTNCVQGNTSAWTTISFTTLIEPCDAPTGLTASNTTHNSSDLSWNVQGSNAFEYVVDQIAADPAIAGTPTTGTTFNAPTLNPLTTYYLHVRTNCVQGNTSAWTTISFTTLVTPCDTTSGLNAANTTHHSSDLSWDPQSGSTFEYVLNQIAADPATAGTPTTGTTYNATLLNPMTTYYMHVRSDCGSGNLSPWTTISFTTLVTPCAAPTGLTAANTTDNSSNLSWNAQGSNTFEYLVDQMAADPIINGTPTTGTTYNATLLSPLTTYYLHVRTDCSGTNFSPWVTIPFTTLATPCAAPTGLNAANTTDNSSDLSWNTQGGNTFEYVVDQTAAAPATVGTATSGTTFNATTLTALTTYYLHVRTDCGSGNLSSWTTISFTTLATPCVAPTGLTAVNTTDNSSDLSWNIQGGNSFEYLVDQTAADPATAGTPTTATSHHAATLSSSTTYYLHVRTDCGSGNFSDWTTISFTTLTAPCVAPTGVVASNIAGHSANLAWNAQSGSTFEYVIDQTNTNPAGSGTATTGTTFAASALAGSTTYYFHIRTNCGNGNFSNWTTISFTTSSTAGIDEQEALNLTAYPNPTNGSVTVSGQTEAVTLTNLKGQQLMVIDLQQQTTLDVSNLESGMYFLVYTNGNKSALIKLIKE